MKLLSRSEAHKLKLAQNFILACTNKILFKIWLSRHRKICISSFPSDTVQFLLWHQRVGAKELVSATINGLLVHLRPAWASPPAPYKHLSLSS